MRPEQWITWKNWPTTFRKLLVSVNLTSLSTRTTRIHPETCKIWPRFVKPITCPPSKNISRVSFFFFFFTFRNQIQKKQKNSESKMIRSMDRASFGIKKKNKIVEGSNQIADQSATHRYDVISFRFFFFYFEKKNVNLAINLIFFSFRWFIYGNHNFPTLIVP